MVNQIKPVFITGYNKSGTTLLLSLLDSHPELIVFPEELHYFHYVFGKKEKLKLIKSKTGIRLFLNKNNLSTWSKGKSWHEKGYDNFNYALFNQQIDDILKGETVDKTILEKIIFLFAQAANIDLKNKKFWVTKTTQNELFFPIINKLYNGRAKFIYVYRDPRDVYTSVQKRYSIIKGVKEKQISKSFMKNFIFNWMIRDDYITKLLKRNYPILTIKYEDLISESNNTIKKIISFLEIKENEILFKPTRLSNSWKGNSVFNNNNKGIYTGTLKRYQAALSDSEIAAIEFFLKDILIRENYQIENVKTERPSDYFKFQIKHFQNSILYSIRKIKLRKK